MPQKARNINITPNALPGRRLEAGWDKELGQIGGTYDKRDLSSLWKSPNWSGKLSADNINLTQQSRLGVFGKPKEDGTVQ
jgi:hypothetical protein